MSDEMRLYEVGDMKKFQIEGTTHVALEITEMKRGRRKSEILVINAAEHPEVLFTDDEVLIGPEYEKYLSWSNKK